MEISISDSALTAWLGPARAGMSDHQYETYAMLARNCLDRHPEWMASAAARVWHSEDIEQVHRDAQRIAELTRWHTPYGGVQRPAEPGETCTCGRPAIVVIDTKTHGDVPCCRR